MKIISMREGFCANHSADDYVFISSRKLSQQEIKKAERLWLKETRKQGYGEEETIGVGEYGFSHNSWYPFLEDLEDEFMEKLFDIEIKSYELGGRDKIKFGYDYDEELYKRLTMCSGYGEDGRISVSKKGKRIILELNFYIDTYDVFEDRGLFYKFLERVREDILKGDLTVLRCIGEFYSIKAEVSWKEPGEPTERAILFKKMLREEEEW